VPVGRSLKLDLIAEATSRGRSESACETLHRGTSSGRTDAASSRGGLPSGFRRGEVLRSFCGGKIAGIIGELIKLEYKK